MKAKEAPEKIYIPTILVANVVRYKEEGSIEYIRTDAFTEKAVNFVEMLGNGFTITGNITHTNYDKEQLIADFRKYMEGE